MPFALKSPAGLLKSTRVFGRKVYTSLVVLFWQLDKVQPNPEN